MFKKICFFKRKKIQFKKDLVTIKRKFTKYNPQTHVLSLDNINLSQNDDAVLSDIFNLIKRNKNIFYLSKNIFIDELLTKNLKKKYEIDQLLIDNKFNYETFPSDYIHCLIANHVYCYVYNSYSSDRINDDIISGFSPTYNKFSYAYWSRIRKIENDNYHCDRVWKKLSKLGWIIHSVYRTSGYKSIIYINENKKQILVGYQGMIFKFKDLFAKNYKTYIESLQKNLIKKHLNIMIQNVKRCIELSTELNYSLSFTGYSFGAMLAQLSLFICHKYLNKTTLVRSVVFESIGLFELLNKLNLYTNKNNIINLNDLDLRVFLMRPSFFNTINTHAGTICDIYVENGREVFDYANAAILRLLRDEFPIFNQFDIENCSVHRFYLNGLKSLLSINIKFFLFKFTLFNSHSINVYTKWPCNFKIEILDPKSKYFEKIDNSVIISKFIKDAILRIFKSTELIENFKVLETKLDFVDSYLNPQSYIRIGKKPMIKDYSDDISNDENFDVKVLNFNNKIENYLDNIYKIYKRFKYKTSEIEDDFLFDSIQFNENTLIKKHLINLIAEFHIFYDSNHVKSIGTKKKIPIHKIFELFLHLCDLNPNLKTNIDLDCLEFNQSLKKNELLLYKDFCDKTDSLLNDYIDLKRDYNLSHPLTVIIGECGTGKSTLAAKLAKDLVDVSDNSLAKLIDCSSTHSVFMNFKELARICPINQNLELTIYNKINCLIPFLLEININQVILILDDLQALSLLNDFVQLEKEYRKNNLILNLIITIDENKDTRVLKLDNYNLIKLGKLDKNDCHFILKDLDSYLTNIFNANYSLDNFINDLLENEKYNKVEIFKIKSLKNMLKRNCTRNLNKNEILKYKEDIFDFIRCDNKSVYDFLFYIIHLNTNYLNINLLKHVYKLINNYDLINFQKEKSFAINFNSDLEYLIDMCILTKSYDDNYVMHSLLQHEFESRIMINDEFKLRIILVDLLALNQFAESNRTILNRSELYYLHLDNLSNRYLLIFDELEEMVKNNLEQFNAFKNFFDAYDIDSSCDDSLSLNLAHIDDFFLRYKENFKEKLDEFKQSFYETSENSRKFLTCGLDILNNNVEEVKNKMYLDLEEKILCLKNIYEVDPTLDVYELDPSINFELISKIYKLKKSFKKLSHKIDSYKKTCFYSYKDNKKKRKLLHVSLNNIFDYLKYFFKEIDSNAFCSDKEVTLNYNKALKELIGLEDFFSTIKIYAYTILFPNGSIHYEESNRNEDSKLGKICYNSVEKKRAKIKI